MYLDSSIGHAHKTLPDVVRAMSNMALLDVNGKVFIGDFSALESSMMTSPISAPQCVQTMQLVEDGEARSGGCDGWMYKESTLCWEYVSPCSIGVIRRWVGKAPVIMEGVCDGVDCLSLVNFLESVGDCLQGSVASFRVFSE